MNASEISFAILDKLESLRRESMEMARLDGVSGNVTRSDWNLARAEALQDAILIVSQEIYAQMRSIKDVIEAREREELWPKIKLATATTGWATATTAAAKRPTPCAKTAAASNAED